MATFEYQALTAGGRLMKGTLEAPSKEHAAEMLTEMQLTVSELGKGAQQRPRTRIGRSEFLLFNQQLASLTKAGIPLERGLRELSSDVESRSMRRLVLAVADDLESGMSIEEAFEKRKGAFPPLYGEIVKAGVQTGRLGDMLSTLNRHLEIGNQTRRILFEAMAYPVVVLALAAVILTAVFYVVVPQFRAIFSDIGEDLPMLTGWVLNMSDNVIPFWIAVGVIVAATAILTISLSGFPAGRRFKETLLMRVPVLGSLYHRGVLGRLADAMALLVAAGSDMPTSLSLAAGATGSETLKSDCQFLATQIEQGENLVEAGQFCVAIPPLFLYSIQLGSQRSELQDNLYGLSEMYMGQVRTPQSRLQALLLPVMLIFVGGFVALTVLGLFMPMIAMINSMIEF